MSDNESVLSIPVVKSKGTVEVDVARIDERYYRHALELGMKHIVNGGTSSITPAKVPNEEQRMAAAQKMAEQRVQEIYENKLVIRGAAKAAKSDTPAAVLTEGRRIARDMVKAAMKAKKIKISGYKSSEITAMANDLLNSVEHRPALLAQAEKNLAERGKLPMSIDTVDLSGLPGITPTERAPLSAAKAGQTEHRATHAPH